MLVTGELKRQTIALKLAGMAIFIASDCLDKNANQLLPLIPICFLIQNAIQFVAANVNTSSA